MSLYALLPNPQSNGSCLYQPTSSAFYVAQRFANHSATEPKPRVIVDFSNLSFDNTLELSIKKISRSSSASTAEETLCTSISSIHTTQHDQHLKISIREVKINFHKLANSHSHCASNSGGSVVRSKRDSRLRRRKRQESTISGAGQDLTSDENAIEFDVVVQYVGRKYFAKRTLIQIAQLREDLLEEMAFMEKLQQQRKWTDESSESSTSWDSDISSVDIPSVPRMSEAGVFGCGFSQMSGIMQAYRPALETWFHTVVATVAEDSPILADFLWEPLSEDALHATLKQLGPIRE